MFFEEGWTSLADVTAEVTTRVETFHARAADKAGSGPVPRAQVLHDVAISVWEICEAATKAGVTTGTGNLVPASKLLITWDDPRQLWNRHLDVRLGNVGSAPGTASDAELRNRYGAFLYLPLSVPQNGVESSLSFLDEELAGKDAQREEEMQVAARIVAALDAGRVMTRHIARTDLGAALTRRSFKMAWSAAVDARPALAADPDAKG